MHNSFSKYLWKTTIDVSDFTSGETHSITLREPNMAEWKEIARIQKDAQQLRDEGNEIDSIFAIEPFKDVLSTLIVDSDFYEGEGEQKRCLPAKDVAEFCGSKLDLLSYLMGDYLSKVPLLNRNGTK